MKRMMGFMILVIVLMVPTVSLAASDQLGIYVAPKFTFGGLMGHDTKFNWSTTESGKTGLPDSKSGKVVNDGDWVYGGALAIGYDFHPRFNFPMRLEVEYSLLSDAKSKHHYNSVSSVTGDWERQTSKVTLGIQTLFTNVYYDFHNSSDFTPYIGGGLGMSFISMKGSNFEGDHDGSESFSIKKKSSTNFAWNLNAGVAYAFTENISLDLGYRFSGLGKGETKNTNTTGSSHHSGNTFEKWKTDDLYVHQVMAGLRFTF